MSDTITLIQRSQQGDRDASERLVTENTGLIGVSQVQVSRIEKKALERLRTFF